MAEWPPTKWQDIEDYDHSEVVEGYREYREGDPQPGPNHSPAYRWGWQNGYYDHHSRDGDDGFARIRSDYIRESGRWRRMPHGLQMVVPS